MSGQKTLDRRGFLKGSILSAAAGLAAAVPAYAQGPATPAPEQKPDGPKEGEQKKEPPSESKPAPKKDVLIDKQGREYRVCDMCGGNMYVEEKRWTCDQCGFSYEV